MPALTAADIERFHRLVAGGDPDECWPWPLGKDKDGYGKFSARGTTLRAHRVAYFLATGIDPGDALILHTCDNPPCCNPGHIFDGTAQVNILDCKAKGRLNTAAGSLHGSQTKPSSRARGERAGGAKLTAEQVADIRTSYLAGGITHQQLADRYEVRREAVSCVLRGENWRHLDTGDTERIAALGRSQKVKRGSENANAKLDEAIVADIRARYVAGGTTYAKLAAEYGVSLALVRFVVTRRIWRHVP